MPTLFIVDDDDLILKSLGRIFRRPGVKVTTFNSADAALAAMAERPDVVICDYHMPKVDGLDIVSAAKRANSAARTVLLSGGCEDDRVLAALSGGTLDRFITKPWHHEELIELVSGFFAPPPS